MIKTMSRAIRLAIAILVLVAAGCQTTPQRLSPINFNQPGWTLRQGQAIWKTKGSEIAGEVVLAHNEQNRSWVQFSKTPLPIVTAQLEGDRWECEFHSEARTLSGRGKAPVQLAWLHFLSAVNGKKPGTPFKFSKTADGGSILENTRNGEMLTIYLNP